MCIRDSVVTATTELFERVWAGASPVGDQAYGGADGQRELLGLLLAGHTEEQAATHLNVSERTVRRMVSSLLRSLNARSWFEAGARVVLDGGFPELTRRSM